MDFLTDLQRSFAAPRPKQGASTRRQSHHWFMKDGVSVGLTDADLTVYHEVVEALLSGLGKTRREVVSRGTVEGIVRGAIVAVASGPKTPKTVSDVIETLRKELHAPAVAWELWCAVVDLVPTRRRRKFGRVSFQAASPRAVRALTRRSKGFIESAENTPKQKAALKKIVDTEMTSALKGRVIASVTVRAVDEESAARLAIQQVRATHSM